MNTNTRTEREPFIPDLYSTINIVRGNKVVKNEYQSYSIRRPLASSTIPPQPDRDDPFDPKWSEGDNSFTLSCRNTTPVFASKSENRGAISHASTSASDFDTKIN